MWQKPEKALISARINSPPGEDAQASRAEER
jgi:hypothetical protein